MFYNWYKDILNENIEKGNYNIQLKDNNIQLSNYINSTPHNVNDVCIVCCLMIISCKWIIDLIID